MKQVNLAAVAQAAGCSIRTVGRVLNGVGPVRASTAERVRRVAAEAGYVPNVLGRMLRAGRPPLVGVVAGGSFREARERRTRSLLAALAAHGFPALTAILPPRVGEVKRLLDSWRALAGAVIFTGWLEGERDVDFLSAAPCRCAFFDCGFDLRGHFRILTAREAGMAAAVGELYASGRRRIACVSSRPPGELHFLRESAARLGDDLEAILLTAAHDDYGDGYRAGRALTAAGADAVCFDSDRMALGFYRYAAERQLRIPEEIAVIGFDDDRAGAFAIPTLSTIAHPPEAGAERLCRWLETGCAETGTVSLPAQLIVRESL